MKSAYTFNWSDLTDAEKARMFPTYKFLAQTILKKYTDSVVRYPDGYHTKELKFLLDMIAHGFHECEVSRKREELIEAQQAKLKEF